MTFSRRCPEQGARRECTPTQASCCKLGADVRLLFLLLVERPPTPLAFGGRFRLWLCGKISLVSVSLQAPPLLEATPQAILSGSGAVRCMGLYGPLQTWWSPCSGGVSGGVWARRRFQPKGVFSENRDRDTFARMFDALAPGPGLQLPLVDRLPPSRPPNGYMSSCSYRPHGAPTDMPTNI